MFYISFVFKVSAHYHVFLITKNVILTLFILYKLLYIYSIYLHMHKLSIRCGSCLYITLCTVHGRWFDIRGLFDICECEADERVIKVTTTMKHWNTIHDFIWFNYMPVFFFTYLNSFNCSSTLYILLRIRGVGMSLTLGGIISETWQIR